MVTIIFETHSTSMDNEARLASGWEDVALSSKGMLQAKELGTRYAHDTFAAIFCSDLQRSYKTAELAFGSRFLIVKDAALRECNYGDCTRKPVQEVELEKSRRIHLPFPNGESYTQTCERMKGFLSDLIKLYAGKKILIIGHRATQYALEHLINGISLEEAVSAPFTWQPGWTYALNGTDTLM